MQLEPAEARAIARDVKPLSVDEQRTSPQFFKILNFVLQFCPAHPSEKDLMARFARLGVGAHGRFDPETLSAEVLKAVQDGIADAWQTYADLKKRVDAKEVASGDMFGTRDFLKNNYLYRMAAAILGIYGNSKQEAMYPLYTLDADGQLLNASSNRYGLRFAPGKLSTPSGL